MTLLFPRPFTIRKLKADITFSDEGADELMNQPANFIYEAAQTVQGQATFYTEKDLAHLAGGDRLASSGFVDTEASELVSLGLVTTGLEDLDDLVKGKISNIGYGSALFVAKVIPKVRQSSGEPWRFIRLEFSDRKPSQGE